MTTTPATPLRLGARVGTLPGWQAARLVYAWDESATARTLVLEVPTWPGHVAGQHVDLRLRAEDGYTAERSYSIGSAPGAGSGGGSEFGSGSGTARAIFHPAARSSRPPARPATIARAVPDPSSRTSPLPLSGFETPSLAEAGSSARLGSSGGGAPRIAVTVQRVPGGEVSSYLVDQFEVGYPIELRGPVGGWFVWAPDGPGATPGVPVLLIAGGSGLVPLMAMVRARRDAGSRDPFRLLYSVRTPADRLYVDELEQPRPGDAGLDTSVLYTRAAPLGTAGGGLAARREPGRISAADLARFGWPAELEPVCFVCGPTPFVESVARMLLALGHAPERIRTERFGPTGE